MPASAPTRLPDAPIIAAGPPAARRGLRGLVNPAYLPLIATLTVLILLLVIGRTQYANFTSPKSLADLFNENAVVGVAAIGATVVILSGGIDLSIGSMVAFATIVIAKGICPTLATQVAHLAGEFKLDPSVVWQIVHDPTLATKFGVQVEDASRFTGLVDGFGIHPLLAAAIALGLGAAFGCLMGTLIALYELPPFMVTLAGMFFARAMGFVVHEQNLDINHPFYKTIGDLKVLVMPGIPGRAAANIQPVTFVMLGMFAIAIVVLQFTSFGRNIYAIGGDENSSRLLGVPITRTKISAYTISGFCSALAGVLVTVYKQSGDPASQVGLELDAIAAVVIGGTLLTGGRGFVIGTLLGVLMLGLIQNFINFNGHIRTEWTRIFIGTLMLAFILMQGGFNVIGRWLSTTKPSGRRGFEVGAAH